MGKLLRKIRDGRRRVDTGDAHGVLGNGVDGIGESQTTSPAIACVHRQDRNAQGRGESGRQGAGLHGGGGRVRGFRRQVEHGESHDKRHAGLGNLSQQVERPGQSGGIQDDDDDPRLATHIYDAPGKLPDCVSSDLLVG